MHILICSFHNMQDFIVTTKELVTLFLPFIGTNICPKTAIDLVIDQLPIGIDLYKQQGTLEYLHDCSILLDYLYEHFIDKELFISKYYQ